MASVLKVDQLQGVSTTANVHIPGNVVQVIQGTAGEQTQNASNVVLINNQFTPKFSGSKFYVSFTIPNLTGDASPYSYKSVYWDKC